MARKQYRDSLTKYWDEQIEMKLQEEKMLSEITDMLGGINEKRDLV